ncbi:MAG: hypothetical protein HY601_01640 [Candidatus Omnitrophica bacterium]|nr:hypothetical protein [Candidatus Omnitrophota bacterium]
MPLTRWLTLIGIVMLLGWLQVIQRNNAYLQAYALGSLQQQLHREATEVAWMDVQVQRLASPTALARAQETRKLELAAWKTLPALAPLAQLASAPPQDQAGLGD